MNARSSYTAPAAQQNERPAEHSQGKVRSKASSSIWRASGSPTKTKDIRHFSFSFKGGIAAFFLNQQLRSAQERLRTKARTSSKPSENFRDFHARMGGVFFCPHEGSISASAMNLHA